MLLGMPKRRISLILVYETLTVGILSLFAGLAAGILCSQMMGYLSAQMLQVQISYHVFISIPSACVTILSFSVIFIVIMMLNTRIIGKVHLIDLLHSKKKQEKSRLNRPWQSVIVFLISLIMLGAAYYMATLSLQSFAIFLVPILIIGGIGTILFFVSLSGFMLLFIRLSKKTYYHNLNMVVLRQINAKISSTSLSMGIVCLMLLLSIGALSCGFSLQNSLQDQIESITPYSYTYMQNESIPESDMKQLLQLDQVQEYTQVRVYEDGSTLEPLMSYMQGSDTDKLYAGATLQFVSLHDFNEAMKMQGKKGAELKENEVFFISGNEQVLDVINTLAQNHPEQKLLNTPVRFKAVRMGQDALSSGETAQMLTIIVNDKMLTGMQPVETLWNVNLNDAQSSKTYSMAVEERFQTYALQHAIEGYHYTGITREDTEEIYMGTGMLFIYIGMYLGIVFLVSSAAILALQQLSEAEDNKASYDVLKKIGTPNKMIHRSILLQIAIYFLMPMVLALVHSFVGVPVVSQAFSFLFGLQNMWKSNLLTGGILLLIYGAYFLVTYQGYRRAIQKN